MESYKKIIAKNVSEEEKDNGNGKREYMRRLVRKNKKRIDDFGQKKWHENYMYIIFFFWGGEETVKDE